MMSANGKPLRFANLIRVSTEKQEKKGESLRTQQTNNARDVKRLGGTIVGTYGGQEHGTPEWERKELDRLLADAVKGAFDAIIVAYPDRWSRDNERSKQDLKKLRQHHIRFFVSTMEMDLYDPQHRFILGMNAEVGEFAAALASKKSLEVRIASAREGRPSSNQQLPYGRTYDKDKAGLKVAERWGIDKDKQALIKDIAGRYLAGESMPKLAREIGMHRGQLWKILRNQCGDQWTIDFRCDDFNIHESVTIAVPPLLDKTTIKRVRARLEANRTYLRQPSNRRHHYLLSGKVFCSGCGYSMLGQPNSKGDLYYKHARTDERKRPCPVCEGLNGRKPWVRADELEALVTRDLFNLLGNPAAIQKAVKAAVPDCDKVMKRKAKVEGELARIDKARKRLVSLIVKGTISDEEAESQLDELKRQRTDFEAELEALAAALIEVPTEDGIKLFVERTKGQGLNPDTIWVYGDHDPDLVQDLRDKGLSDKEINALTTKALGGNDISTALSMSDADIKKLVASMFDGRLPDGKPAGVYVTVLPKVKGQRSRPFKYELRGRLQLGSLPCSWGCSASSPRGTPGRTSPPFAAASVASRHCR
jgi:DNA invertase Pin-like site-specific DNA recombinase